MTVTLHNFKTQRGYGAAPLRNIEILEQLLARTMDRAPHLPGIVTFSGPSGFGKSTAVAYVAAQQNGVYVEVRSVWTKKAFLEHLSTMLGLKQTSTIAGMADAVSHELAMSGRPLLIDEGDNLVNRNLVELVRDIYEQSKASIVLIGEEMLPQKLKQWERFHGRIMAWAQAVPADANDVLALAAHYTPGLNLAPDMVDRLVQEAKGSVRRIVTNLDEIAIVARGEGWKQVGVKEWGNRGLHTATPPSARSF